MTELLRSCVYMTSRQMPKRHRDTFERGGEQRGTGLKGSRAILRSSLTQFLTLVKLSTSVMSNTSSHGLTLVHNSAQRKRFLRDRGEVRGCLGGV